MCIRDRPSPEINDLIVNVVRVTDNVMKTKPKVKGNYIMKKIIAFALAAIMALSFAACVKQNGESGTTTPSDEMCIRDSLFSFFQSFSYPIPTHSRHNRIALLNTVSTSPRKAP